MSENQSYLSHRVVSYLLEPIRGSRVNRRDGNSYVEAHDIKAELIRVFGFGRWSWVIREAVIEHKEPTKTNAGKDAWYVVARTVGDLTVCAPDGTVLATYSGSHAGNSTHPVLGEAIGNALTFSDSFALKRAATCALGDAGGLGLYNGGSLDALVRGTFVMPGAEDHGDHKPELPASPAVEAESLSATPTDPFGTPLAESTTIELPDLSQQKAAAEEVLIKQWRASLAACETKRGLAALGASIPKVASADDTRALLQREHAHRMHELEPSRATSEVPA